jgi:hypothetical protein
MNLQLAVDVLDVERDGVDAGAQLSGGGPVAVSFNEELQQAQLVRREIVRSKWPKTAHFDESGEGIRPHILVGTNCPEPGRLRRSDD